MNNFNISFLIKISINNIIENIDSIFENLLKEIKLYLNVDVLFTKIKLEFTEFDEYIEDFINFGVKKTQINNTLRISILNEYKKYLKVILLREAYKCFIPGDITENDIINIFIDEKVEIDLQNSDIIEDWQELRRKRIISYDFMEKHFDRIEKFLRQESSEGKPTPFQYFFSYIRRNFDLITNAVKGYYNSKGFYDIIYEEYALKYTEYPDEIIETIRIITSIFYNVKIYGSVLDYKNHFKNLKESEAFITTLSLRKFAENMQWIKNSTIAPTYQINWPTLNLSLLFFLMKFNPNIEINRVQKIVNQLPFSFNLYYSRYNFGIEVIGWFLLPKVYLKDLFGFLERLESNGYLIEKKLYAITRPEYTTNLNHFKEFARREVLVNSDKKDYQTEYELEFHMDYGHGTYNYNLSLLDWLLIDRIRYFSITGFGFERKNETLNQLKSDLLNEVLSQRNLISEIKKNLNKIHKSPHLRKNILDLIDNNKSFGFFYIKQIISNYVTIINIISNIVKENSSIKNSYQSQEIFSKQGISRSIEDNIMFNTHEKSAFKKIISSRFRSRNNLEQLLEEYSSYYNLFKSFYDLKLYDLNSIKSVIKDKSLIEKIYKSKEKKLRNSYEIYKTYNITNQLIDQRLENYLNNSPPVIKPSLLNTIISAFFTKFLLTLILKDSSETRNAISKVKWLFPRVLIGKMLDYKTNKKYIFFQIQMQNIKLKEKLLLFSILYNAFQENLINIKSYNRSGFSEAYSRKDFYDLEQEDYFYSRDLFEQFYLYIEKIIKYKLDPLSELKVKSSGDFWGKQKSFSPLINEIENRISKEHIDLSIDNLNSLINYNKELIKNLRELEEFKHFKNEYFFINYIKSINFIPSLQSFGFGQYFLYFYPIDLNEIDFKHFLHNSFQKIKYPANIDNSNSFLIDFIWPYRNPNISLLRWLTKSKKVIREYCFFFIKKVLQIFHFNQNLSVNEWDLDPNRFKIYFQNVLFNPDYKLTIPEFREFNIGDLNIFNSFTPESPEFEALTQLYGWKSIDIKTYLGTRNYTMVKSIIDLLEKKLIFPFISVKNLDLIEKLYIILPNVKKEHNEKLLKIFSFFNVGFIHEMEGEYYIYGMPEEIKFENGLMIKLYLPDCQLDEFEKLFDLVFEYLGIKHYIILNDLVDGTEFLKSIYGNLDFMKSYNPLKSLIWNEKDKIWMNHKLFDGKFRKIYPDLFPNG